MCLLNRGKIRAKSVAPGYPPRVARRRPVARGVSPQACSTSKQSNFFGDSDRALRLSHLSFRSPGFLAAVPQKLCMYTCSKKMGLR